MPLVLGFVVRDNRITHRICPQGEFGKTHYNVMHWAFNEILPAATCDRAWGSSPGSAHFGRSDCVIRGQVFPAVLYLLSPRVRFSQESTWLAHPPITLGITKWLPSNSHRAINAVSVECRVVGSPLKNICIFLLGLWEKKIGMFPQPWSYSNDGLLSFLSPAFILHFIITINDNYLLWLLLWQMRQSNSVNTLLLNW